MCASAEFLGIERIYRDMGLGRSNRDIGLCASAEFLGIERIYRDMGLGRSNRDIGCQIVRGRENL